MKNINMRNCVARTCLVVSICLCMLSADLASVVSTTCRADERMNQYFFSETLNTGHDNGYSEGERMTHSDPHYGWEIGQFCVEGFTDQTTDSDGNVVFLKNVGDTVSLSFELTEDIDELDGDSDLSVSEDTNGYDEYFGTEKTNCGHGMLIIRKIEPDNSIGEPQIYTDYLSGIEEFACTEIDLFEEGDYEVALDYEIEEERHLIGPIPWFSEYHDYRIFFRFSVRNSNCMAYPFEIETGRELTNGATTDYGFYLDFVNSRYLDICVQYETVAEDGSSSDVRYNRAAHEGECYTEEGLYTITVRNRYTLQTTTKVIHVGGSERVAEAIVEALATGSRVRPMRETADRTRSSLSNAEQGHSIVMYGIFSCLILISVALVRICFLLVMKSER